MISLCSEATWSYSSGISGEIVNNSAGLNQVRKFGSQLVQLSTVQRMAARYVSNDYRTTSSVTDMLCEPGWPSLETRREVKSLVMQNKTHNGLLAIDKDKYLEPLNRQSRHTHALSYKIPPSRSKYRLFYFIFFHAPLGNGTLCH